MESDGIGESVYELRKKIQELQTELSQLGDPATEIPELVSSANALRSCEFLQKQNDKQSELLKVYAQYSKSLNNFLATVFEIQNDLKDIIQEQSLLLSEIDSTEKPTTEKPTTEKPTTEKPDTDKLLLRTTKAKTTKAKTTKAKTTKAKKKSSKK